MKYKKRTLNFGVYFNGCELGWAGGKKTRDRKSVDFFTNSGNLIVVELWQIGRTMWRTNLTQNLQKTNEIFTKKLDL